MSKKNALISKIGDSGLYKRICNSTAGLLLEKVLRKCGCNPFPAQVCMTIVYRLLLDMIYVDVISPIFAYTGFRLTIYPVQYLTSILAVILFAPFIVKLLEYRNPSSILITFINYAYFIPFTSYCGCIGAQPAFFCVGLAYWVIILLLQFVVPILEVAPLKRKNMEWFFAVLTVISVAFIVYVSGKYTGFRLTLDILNVYEIRAEAKSYEISGLMSYVLSAMTIVLTIVLLYWLRAKKYILGAMLIVVYLLYYSISAQKSVFFLLGIALAVFLFFRDWMLKWLPGLLCFFTCIAYGEYKIHGSFYLITYMIRRVMYLPVLISEQRMDFFKENPLNLFRDGIMGKFSFENIYSTNIPYVIGEYRGNYGEAANNGMLGDLLSNLPVLVGLLTMPLILVICFRFLDMFAGKVEKKYVLPFCFLFANSFINSTWSTVLLTGGFLLACVMLYFFPKEENLSV